MSREKDKMGNYGLRIRIIRELLGWSQAQLAEKLGLGGPTAISKYENALREPEFSVITDIAKLGNTSIDWLLSGLGWSFVPSTQLRAVGWIKTILDRHGIIKILIVTYEGDIYNAHGDREMKNGFILETDHGVLSMAGDATKTTTTSGMAAYLDIMHILLGRRIPTYRISYEYDQKEIDWDKENLSTYLSNLNAKEIDIDAEIQRIKPFATADVGHEPIDITDPELSEIVKLLQTEIPEMKQQLLKMLRARKNDLDLITKLRELKEIQSKQ